MEKAPRSQYGGTNGQTHESRPAQSYPVASASFSGEEFLKSLLKFNYFATAHNDLLDASLIPLFFVSEHSQITAAPMGQAVSLFYLLIKFILII